MRHLELPAIKLDYSDVKIECDIDIKDEDLEDLDIKDELIDVEEFEEALKTIIDLQNCDKNDLVANEPDSEGNSRLCTNSKIAQISLDLLDKNDQSIDLQNENKKKGSQSALQKDRKELWNFKCIHCRKSWTSKASFDEHYRASYGLEPVYICVYCNKTTDKYSSFRSHCYMHAMEGRYPCFECGKQYSTKSLLNAHQQMKHCDENPISCDKCPKFFKNYSLLKTHQQREHNEGPNIFPCEECGKILKTKGGLHSHFAVHKSGKKFMCHVCGNTFTQKINLQLHIERQHINNRPYTCEICGKSFTERANLSRHSQYHSTNRPWHCDVCNRFYKTERCLKVHKLVHSEYRPYTCEFCGKGFLSSTKLKQHLNIHTGERPYKCQICGKTFTNYPNWLKHTKRKHPSEADTLRKRRNIEKK